MNTQPHRDDLTDQPWLGFPLEPSATLAALGFWPGQSTVTPQPWQPHHPPGSHALRLQPRHTLSHGGLCAAEASLPPGTPIANSDEAAQLGAWLMEATCHEAQDWNAITVSPVIASIHLPTSLFRRDRLVAQVKRALARSNLPPCQLELQLPEQIATQGDPDLALCLAALRDLGVGLGLAHFGTLTVNLRTLQRLPLTSMKLEPTLVRDLVQDRTARLTVKAAIALAHSLDATVLAPGVANPTQRDILADLGCDQAQGPIFGGTLQAKTFHAALLPVPR